MDDNGSVRGVILDGDLDATRSAEWDGCPGLLLPMANTPLVVRIIEAYARTGVRETLIAAGRDTTEIASLCGDGARWNMTLSYRDGRGGQSRYEHARELAAFTKNAPFLLTPGPLLIQSEDCETLVQSYFESHPCGIRAGRTSGKTTCTSGVADGCTGIYLMTSKIYDALQNEDTGDDTLENLFDSALDELVRRGETVLNRDLDHPPFGVGSPEAYLDANERLLASNEGLLGPESGSEESTLPEIMDDNFSSPNLVLRPPVIVDATAELERCRIGPNVCIGHEVRIGHGAAIEHSVIMEGADIGDGASISHAVIGKNTSIENRSVIHGLTDQVRVVRSN